jgi:hypothetical protein
MSAPITETMTETFSQIARTALAIAADRDQIQKEAAQGREDARIDVRECELYQHGAAVMRAAGFCPQPEGGFTNAKRGEFKGSRGKSSAFKRALVAGGMSETAAKDFVFVARNIALGHRKGSTGMVAVEELATCKSPEQFGSALEMLNLTTRNKIAGFFRKRTDAEEAARIFGNLAKQAGSLAELLAGMTTGQRNEMIKLIGSELPEGIGTIEGIVGSLGFEAKS